MTNDRGVVFSSSLFRGSFLIRHSCLVISVTLLRLRVRCPPQGVFLSRGLVAAHRPPWHQASHHHDLDHDETVEAGGLWRRGQAKRRWKPNRVPIRHAFRTLRRCIARRESEYRSPEEIRRDRFALRWQSFSLLLGSDHWPSQRAKIGKARDPAEKRLSRRW